ncbi:hypothetical protein [Acanthopleuribacter pedis]|uniref:Uncharacterized protein n=1 Tax=Acanthopleuribacter pedis TaxID=442870 RepID=A0A8J7Q9C9_9BACT|nr:hypothetical protein [Acanthopleuribacter pedis]MBO1320295.1 hypothetical protein [Acanthopleuribacter pedis]
MALPFSQAPWTLVCTALWSGWFLVSLAAQLFPRHRMIRALRRRDPFGLIPGFRFFSETESIIRIQVSHDPEGRHWQTLPAYNSFSWWTPLWNSASRRDHLVTAYVVGLIELAEKVPVTEHHERALLWTPYAALSAFCREQAARQGATQVRFRLQRAPVNAANPSFTVVFCSPSLSVRETR